MVTKARTASAPDRVPDGRKVRGPSVGIAALIFFGLSFLYFVPALLPGRHIFGTDYFAGGYFFYDFVAQRLADGELPKWVPYIFGGLPLFANPGSAYQPVHLLASLLLPTSKVLAVVFVVHFGLAGLGGFLLAREIGCRSWIAVLAGIAYEFTGLLTSWVYAGHDGRIIVATVAPLFFFFLRRGIRTAGVAPFAGAAATLGLALLSFQIQNSYYLLLAAAVWAVYSLLHLGLAKRPAVLGRVVALGLGAVAVGFLLASVNFLPFLDYIGESPRGQEGGRGYEYATSYSMPPAELVALAVPEEQGISLSDPETGEALFPPYRGANAFKLHTEYVGALVLVLLALGAGYSRGNRDWWFFAGLGAFMLTIAVGGNTPLYRLYYALLPGTKQFRAPSLSFFIVALCLVAMAALTLERLAELRARSAAKPGNGAARELDRVPWIAGGVVVLTVVGAMFAGGDPPAAPGAPTAAAGWGRFGLFAALVAGLISLWSLRKVGTLGISLALAVVCVADLWLIGKEFLHTTDPPEVTFAPDDVIAFLGAQPQPNRVWTFPVPQQYRSGGPYGGDYPMLFDIQQVGGEHPNPLRRWVEYVGAGTESYIDWHNLITEAAVVDTSEGQAIGFRWQTGFLEAANVRYIVSMAPLSHPALREVHRGSALVYEVVTALPRAYLVPATAEIPADASLPAMTQGEWNPREVAFVSGGGEAARLPGGPLRGSAEVVEYEPDRVVVRTQSDRAALLVLADNYYEGWEAEVDGGGAEVLLANHAFRGVVVPAGEHTVEFSFSPADLLTGLYVSAAVGLLLLLYGGWLLIQARGAARAAEA